MDDLIPWLRRSGWAYLAVAALLVAAVWRFGGLAGGERGPVAPGGGGALAIATAPAAAASGGRRATIVVHVAGAVRRPGVYTVDEGARVQRAVARAGGPTRRADMVAINMAAPLSDGQQVIVPRRSATANGPGAAPAGGGGGAVGPLSLSAATAEQLEGLDGIGPTLARRIIEWRDANGPFRSVDQLLEVRGIGPGRFEALRESVAP